MPQDEQLDDYSPDLITLTDEDGKEFSFEVIDAADYNDERYLAVVPYAEDSTEQLEEDEFEPMGPGSEEGEENFVELPGEYIDPGTAKTEGDKK